MKEVDRKASAERFLRAVFRRFGVLKKTEKTLIFLKKTVDKGHPDVVI